MGEASNPGPVHTRQARRLERLGSTQVEPSSDEEISGPPNSGRLVIPRRTGDVPVVASQHNRKLVLTIGTTVGGEASHSSSIVAVFDCSSRQCAVALLRRSGG